MNEAERQMPDDDSDDLAPVDAPGDSAPKERPDPITRTQRHGSEIAEWRAKVLEHRVPKWQWAALALFFLTFVVGALFAPMQDGAPLLGLGMLIVATLVTALGYRSLSKQDRAVRSYAALTPVVDDAILVGEVRIVAAAADTLLKTIANPNSNEAIRRLAILGVMSAAQRIMNRGGVTVETAAVAGYVAWPEIERIEMPGNPGDYQTVHLLRIDASAKRMVDTVERGGTYIAETMATMAGEVVPPARALLALMEAAKPSVRTE